MISNTCKFVAGKRGSFRALSTAAAKPPAAAAPASAAPAAAPAAPPAPVYSTLPTNFAQLNPREKAEISERNAASIRKHFEMNAPAGYNVDIHQVMKPDENVDYTGLRALEGIPDNYKNRKARVEPANLKSLQSSWGRSHRWVVFFETIEQGQRWSNTLTGWTSSSDALSNIRIYFDTKEDAEKYCHSQGWQFTVAEENYEHGPDQDAPKYDENFLPKKLRLMVQKCGPGFYKQHFDNPKYGKSHWFMPLTFHGDKEVEQHGPKAAKA